MHFHHHGLLPRCYQDRTNWPPLAPCQGSPALLFLADLRYLRLDLGQFVNRRSPVQSGSPAPFFQALTDCTKLVESAGVITVLRR